MTEILHAIGQVASLPRKIGLVAVVGCLVGTVLLVSHLVALLLPVPPLVVLVVTWLGWFTWQGWAFGRRRERYLRESPATAYRRAFYCDILPGVSVGVAQMMLPATYGLRLPLSLAASASTLLVATLITATGLTLMISAFKTIGFAGAGFLNEFGYRTREVSDWSIYKYVRHPLFLGGILLSFGCACFFNDPRCLELALANVAVLPIYARLEDRRLVGLLGEDYRLYCMRVGAFFPRFLTRPAQSSAAELDSGMAA